MSNTHATEQAVIATMLHNPERVPACMALFIADDFASPRHREVFSAIASLDERDAPVDALTIWNEIQRRPGESAIGAMAEISKLAAGMPALDEKRIEHAHKELREASTRRRLASICAKAAERFNAGTEPAAEVAAFVEEAMDELRGDMEMRYRPESLADITPRMEAQYEEYVAGTAEIVSSGFLWLDKLLSGGGFKAGQVIVVSAPTGGAKSALGLGIAREIAKRGQGAIFFSLEMMAEELYERLHSAEAEVSTWHFRNHMSSDNHGRLKATLPAMREMKIFIDARSKTLGEIRRHARNLCRQHKDIIKAIVIDYVQLMKMSHESDPNRRTAEVSAISIALKQMAKDLAVPVIILSQLNREYIKIGKPRVEHLRDSGQVGQDADIVIFIDLDEPEERRTYRMGAFRIDKQRGGPKGEAATIFNGQFLTFHDAEGLAGRKAEREAAGLDPEELETEWEEGAISF